MNTCWKKLLFCQFQFLIIIFSFQNNRASTFTYVFLSEHDGSWHYIVYFCKLSFVSLNYGCGITMPPSRFYAIHLRKTPLCFYINYMVKLTDILPNKYLLIEIITIYSSSLYSLPLCIRLFSPIMD